MRTNRVVPTRYGLVASALSIGSAAIFAGCGEDASSPAARPTAVFTADDTTLTAPIEVPSGLVNVEIRSTGTIGHHVVFARLNDGVTFDEVDPANAEDPATGEDDIDPFFTKMTIHGGNGTVAPGTDVSMVLDLPPGNYFALDNPQNESSPTAQFTVVDSGAAGPEPASDGVVTLGPGMLIDVPENFDGRGTWQFVNKDANEVHEAALVKLAPGATATDVVNWSQTFEGPPPIDGEFGSMGALGPGQRAWITMDPGEPGDYVLICFVPGVDGVPHIMKGMVRPVTVR